MKRKLLSLLVLLTVAATGARAGYGWYQGAMSIGGQTTDCTAWSTDGNNPTDIGIVTDMTITSIAFKIWSDANDRGGANMGFNIFDGSGGTPVGTISQDDFHLGTASRIDGPHDFSISWTGSLDLASEVNLTLVPGKTYYIDTWVKTYGSSGDEYISGDNGSNYHAMLTIAPYTIAFATGSGDTGWTVNGKTDNIFAEAGSTITVSYDGTGDHKVKDVKYNYNDTEENVYASGNSCTFTMPAYNVEVSTELYYKLSESVSNSDYTSKTNVYLERTLRTGGWNTFCAPFDINSEKVTALGMTVKELTDASISDKTLTLTFSPASSIEGGKPYLVKVASDLDFTEDGKEFAGIDPDWVAEPVTISGVVTFQPVLVPEGMTANDYTKLFVKDGNTLTFPNANANINAFRAYFKLLLDDVEPGPSPVREFRMNFEDDADAIRSIENGQLIIDNENDAWYDLSGRKMVNGKLPKGIYIHNGRKEVMK